MRRTRPRRTARVDQLGRTEVDQLARTGGGPACPNSARRQRVAGVDQLGRTTGGPDTPTCDNGLGRTATAYTTVTSAKPQKQKLLQFELSQQDLSGCLGGRKRDVPTTALQEQTGGPRSRAARLRVRVNGQELPLVLLAKRLTVPEELAGVRVIATLDRA